MPQHLPSPQLKFAARKLQRVLASPATGGVVKRQTKGRIDAQRVHRAKQGQLDFRKQKWVQDRFTTAVTIVLDFSSSMRSDMPVLQASTRALCEVLEKSGNPYNVYAFGSDADYMASGFRNGEPLSRESHTSKLTDTTSMRRGLSTFGSHGVTSAYNPYHEYAELWEIIGERDTMRSREKQLRDISKDCARSSTPDASCLMGGIQINAAMKADRHIVIMLTDGQGQGSKAIRFCTKYANSIGVETVGICFNSLHVTEGDGQYNASASALCPRHKGGGRIVTAADALTKGFFDGLAKQLGKGLTQKSRVMLS